MDFFGRNINVTFLYHKCKIHVSVCFDWQVVNAKKLNLEL